MNKKYASNEIGLKKVDLNITLRRIMQVPNNVMGPPSSDGRWIAYVDWDSGNLAVLDANSQKTTYLTHKGTWKDSDDYAFRPIISTDSRFIAYSWWNSKEKKDELKIITRDGAHERIIFTSEKDVNPVSWSFDNTAILINVCDQTGCKVFLLSIEDGSMQFIKSMGKYHALSILSPDGRYVLYDFPQEKIPSDWIFWRDESYPCDIYLYDLMEKKEKCLIQHPANDKLVGWSSDGDWILFSSDRTGAEDLWILSVQDGDVLNYPYLVHDKFETYRSDTNPPRVLSPNNSLYFYNLIFKDASWEFYLADFDLEASQLFSSPKFMGVDSWPEYSHDGKFLCWIKDNDQIVVKNLQTDETDTYPTKMGRVVRLRWTRDKQKIYFHAGGDRKSAPNKGIFQIKLQTKEITPFLLTQSNSSYPIGFELSPDDKTMYIRWNDESAAERMDKLLIRRDIETGEQETLYSNPDMFWLTGIDLSPDGERIIFSLHDTETQTARIMSMPSTGGAPTEIISIEKSIPIRRLIWTLDGKNILFLKNFDTRVWMTSTTGDEPEILWDPEVIIRRFRLYPNRKISFQRDPSPIQELWALENFIPTK